MTDPTATESSTQPWVLRRVIAADASVSLRLHSSAQPLIPRPILRSLEISGDGRVFFPVVVSLLLSPLSTNLSRLLLTDLLIGGIIDIVFVGIAKHLVRRPRPLYNKDMFLTFAVDHWSFPSGHSSRACFVATFLSLSSAAVVETVAALRSAKVEFSSKLLDFDEGKAAELVVLIACSWAAATSISRVLLGRHFVCDVVAGACLGILEAVIVFRFLNWSFLEPYFSHVKL